LTLAAGAASQGNNGNDLQECRLEGKAQILSEVGDPHTKGSQIFKVWEVSNLPVYLTTKRPSSGSYGLFLERLLKSGVEIDPVKLLQLNPIHNSLVVIEEARAWIGPINCLEMLLLSEQNDRIALLDDSTEFLSVILRSLDEKRLKIYFFSKNENGIGNVSSIMVKIRADKAQGWILISMLHNHNFELHAPELNAAVAPSVPDGLLNQQLQLRDEIEAAWITNGLNTVRIPARAFGRFQSTP
jgi:hypothetical protein